MENIVDTLVGLDVAILLKKVGFNVPVRGYYFLPEKKKHKDYSNGIHPKLINFNGNTYEDGSDDVSRPSQTVAFKWLMYVKEKHICIDSYFSDGKLKFDYHIKKLGFQDTEDIRGEYEAYEFALEAALKDACEQILKGE